MLKSPAPHIGQKGFTDDESRLSSRNARPQNPILQIFLEPCLPTKSRNCLIGGRIFQRR